MNGGESSGDAGTQRRKLSRCINAGTGRISARIAARPIYFGSVVAVGAGFVWTGNDDERYQRGATVSKLSPRTNHVVAVWAVRRS